MSTRPIISSNSFETSSFSNEQIHAESSSVGSLVNVINPLNQSHTMPAVSKSRGTNDQHVNRIFSERDSNQNFTSEANFKEKSVEKDILPLLESLEDPHQKEIQTLNLELCHKLRQTTSYIKQKKFPEALEILAFRDFPLEKLDGSIVLSLFSTKAFLLNYLEKKEEAISVLKQAQDYLIRTNNNKSPELILFQGIDCYKHNQFEMACRLLHEGLALAPIEMSHFFLCHLGLAYKAMGDLAAARKQFQSGLEIKDLDNNYRVLFAVQLSIIDPDYNSASARLLEAFFYSDINLISKAQILLNLGEFKINQNDLNKAIEYFEQGLDLNCNNEKIHNNLCTHLTLVYERLEKKEQAELYRRKTIENMSQQAELLQSTFSTASDEIKAKVHLSLALELKKMRAFNEAIQALQQGLTLQASLKTQTEIQLELAIIYKDLGHFPEATTAFGEAMRIIQQRARETFTRLQEFFINASQGLGE